jgi:hypothetical protein
MKPLLTCGIRQNLREVRQNLLPSRTNLSRCQIVAALFLSHGNELSDGLIILSKDDFFAFDNRINQIW